MGEKYGGFLVNWTKTSTDYFALEVSTVGRFQNRISIDSIITSANQEEESIVLCIAMKKMRGVDSQLTLDNSKSEKEQGDY